MANRVRGVRQKLANNVLVGRLNAGAGTGNAVPVSITDLANALLATGISPVPSPPGSSLITSVDSNFTVTGGGQLQLHTAADGTIIANISGGSAEPIANTLLAVLNHVFGTTQGTILYQNGTNWVVLSPGVSGQFLKTLGAGANPLWANASPSFTNQGAWNGNNAYNPGDVVQYQNASWLCFSAISAPVAAGSWTNIAGMTISTTTSSNDTATSTATANAAAFMNSNGQNSGKWYVEFQINGWVDNSTQIAAAQSSGGTIANQAAFAKVFGQTDGSALAGGGTGNWDFVSGSKRTAMAIDFGNGKLWFSGDVQAGTIQWNRSTSNNPATNTGGVAIGTTSGVYFPAFYSQSSASQVCQLVTLPANFLIPSVPSGFSAWGPTVAPNANPETDDSHWLCCGPTNLIYPAAHMFGGV